MIQIIIKPKQGLILLKQPKIFFNKKFINSVLTEEEYWHIILEISKKIETKNL
ncbi:hypothetical protein Goshw_019896 [Gossypium schwendimanii]|uniref:Uncharacterized protein n=1 Tax=Gossypium schwendimanii TaxID=34291 RepID=A0A7J9KM76_GOSSC|nr:hypothetical protein [Gossypium schwendimanii]